MVCLWSSNNILLLSLSLFVYRMAKCMSKVHSLTELSLLLEGLTFLTHLRLIFASLKYIQYYVIVHLTIARSFLNAKLIFVAF